MLPQVGPGATAVLVLTAQAPVLAALWRKPAPAAFFDAVVQARCWPSACQLSGHWSMHTLLSACLDGHDASAADLHG